MRGGVPNKLATDDKKRIDKYQKYDVHRADNHTFTVLRSISNSDMMYAYQNELYAVKYCNAWFFKYGSTANSYKYSDVELLPVFEMKKAHKLFAKFSVTRNDLYQMKYIHNYSCNDICKGMYLGIFLHIMETIGHFVIAHVLHDIYSKDVLSISDTKFKINDNHQEIKCIASAMKHAEFFTIHENAQVLKIDDKDVYKLLTIINVIILITQRKTYAYDIKNECNKHKLICKTNRYEYDILNDVLSSIDHDTIKRVYNDFSDMIVSITKGLEQHNIGYYKKWLKDRRIIEKYHDNGAWGLKFCNEFGIKDTSTVDIIFPKSEDAPCNSENNVFNNFNGTS